MTAAWMIDPKGFIKFNHHPSSIKGSITRLGIKIKSVFCMTRQEKIRKGNPIKATNGFKCYI